MCQLRIYLYLIDKNGLIFRGLLGIFWKPAQMKYWRLTKNKFKIYLRIKLYLIKNIDSFIYLYYQDDYPSALVKP